MILSDEFKKQFNEYLKWLFEQRASFILACMNIRQDEELYFDQNTGLMSIPLIAHTEMVEYLQGQGFSLKELAPLHYEVSIVC